MLLCEDEARTKECRAVVHSGPRRTQLGDVSGGAPTIGPCAASGCMHWRWGDSLHETVPVGNEDPRLSPTPPEGDGWRRIPASSGYVWSRVKAKRGYCGLAGRPSETS